MALPLTNIVNVLGWVEADALVYTDAGSTLATNGQAVQQVNDEGGTGSFINQATIGNRPTLATNVANGQPGIRFTRASSQYMNFTTGLAAGTAGLNAVQNTGYSFTLCFTPASTPPDYSTLLGKGAARDGSDRRTWWPFYVTSPCRFRQAGALNQPTGSKCSNGVTYVLSYRYSPSTKDNNNFESSGHETLWLNGRKIFDGPVSLPQWDASQPWQLGALAAADFFDGYIHAAIFRSVPGTDDDRYSIEGYLAAKYGALIFTHRGFAAIPQVLPRLNIVCVGDSRTRGDGIASPGDRSYPNWLRTYLGLPARVHNLGIYGETTTTLLGYAGQREDLLMDPESLNMIFLHIGRNNLSQATGQVAATTADIQTWCTGRKALYPQPLIAVFTEIPSGGTSGTQTAGGYETDRLALNMNLRAALGNGTLAADLLIDIGGGSVVLPMNGKTFDVSGIGLNNNDSGNATSNWNPDTIHLRGNSPIAGYGKVGLVAANAVLQLVKSNPFADVGTVAAFGAAVDPAIGKSPAKVMAAMAAMMASGNVTVTDNGGDGTQTVNFYDLATGTTLVFSVRENKTTGARTAGSMP